MDRFTKKFAQLVPMIRAGDAETLSRQTPSGVRRDIPCAGRTVETYWHNEAAATRHLVFEFHGGGMVLGYTAQNDALRQTLADKADICVVGVDYCKAPEHPYPAAIEESAELIRQTVRSLAAESRRPGHVTLLGCSGGATIAIAVAMKLNGGAGDVHVDGLLLHYPFLDAVTDPGDKPGDDTEALPPEIARSFNQLYAQPEQAGEPCVSPLLAPEELLRLLPDTGLILAGRDALRPEGIAFARRLRELSIPVTVEEYPAACHGFTEDYCNLAIYESRGGQPAGARYDGLMASAPAALEASAEWLIRRTDA